DGRVDYSCRGFSGSSRDNLFYNQKREERE
ncbi:unnamed protein product, partial [marine sediment metagenome]